MTTRYRQLQPEERVTLASLLQQGHSLRSIAKVLERSPSSVSREVARNRSAEGYASQPARQAALARRSRAKRLPGLHADGALWGVVSHLLTWLWSPHQIARTLRRMWPDHPERHRSHRSHVCRFRSKTALCRRICAFPDRRSHGKAR